MAEAFGPRSDDEPRLSLLRRAALSPPETAVAAWRDWHRTIDPWRDDPGSRWWFPLIWWNLRDQPLEPEARRALRQDYSASWIRHQHHASRIAAFIGNLTRLGIDTMLLKGAALALTAYDRPALRPFGDVDVLVRPTDASRARRELERLGWVPIRQLPASLLPVVHSLGYVDARGIDIDMHWHALAECTAAAADEGFWNRSVPIDFSGTSTRALCPADQLLHVCVHGLRHAAIETDHWIADAVSLLRRTASAFDWDACLAEARRRALTWQLLRALERIRHDDSAVVPGAIPVTLRRTRAKWWEPVEYRAKRSTSRAAVVVRLGCVEARARAMGQPGAVLAGLTGHLRALAATERPWRMWGPLLRVAGHGRKAPRRFVAFGRYIQIESEIEAPRLRAALVSRLPAFEAARRRARPDRVYQVLEAGTAASPVPACRVLVNRAPLAATATLEEACDLLVGDLQAFLASAAVGRTFVHAGAVQFRGRVIVLPGASGSGKSTLVAALLRGGGEYYSDEFAIIDDDGGLHPYSRPLRLRRADGTETRIRPKALGARSARGPRPISLILFANYAAHQGLRFEPLSPSQALVHLLNHCPGAHARPDAALTTLRKVAMSAPAWTVDRGEADGLVAALLDGALTGGQQRHSPASTR